MTLTMGKRGTIVIPKSLREKCKIEDGVKIDVSFENNVIVLMPSLTTRTRMDENFDEARTLLESGDVTLEMALAKLTEIKNRGEKPNDVSR